MVLLQCNRLRTDARVYPRTLDMPFSVQDAAPKTVKNALKPKPSHCSQNPQCETVPAQVLEHRRAKQCSAISGLNLGSSLN